MSEIEKQLGTLPWRLMLANGTTLLIESEDDVARLGRTISRATSKDASAEAPKGEAVAWEHTLHMDLGQTETRLTDEADDEPFGRWNVDYDPFYRVTKRPLIYGDTAPPSPKAEPNQSALAAINGLGEAIDKLMHAWVMGERWVRLDDVKAALATQATATQETT